MNTKSCKLKLTLSQGETTSSKTYGNINQEAADAQLKQAGEVISTLQTRTLDYISRIDETIIGGTKALEA